MTELSELRDKLKVGLSGTTPEGAPTTGQIAEQIKTLRASQTIEAAPQRTAKRRLSAEEPVTLVIRRRAEEAVDSTEDDEAPGGMMHQVRVGRDRRAANGRG